ncbi:hypothetical protein LTS18_014823, partial [Coniosporium uncinatum]
MADVEELTDLFTTAMLTPEVVDELQSIQCLYSLSSQELFYKWESYSINMGSESTALDLKTARDFKKSIQEALERENRAKAGGAHIKSEKRVSATPRAGRGDNVFGMLDGLVPNTPKTGSKIGSVKRKADFQTPASKASKAHQASSPLSATPDVIALSSFAERANAGQIVETLNDHIPVPDTASALPTESRIKLK